MLAALLFVIIGQIIEAPAIYWVIFALFALSRFYKDVFGKEK